MISDILRHGMPTTYVVYLVNALNLYDDNINTWKKNGIARALKCHIINETTKVGL
ncbi:MAG: hypothetical protein ABI045_03255 [Flavobacteriales bacterium]